MALVSNATNIFSPLLQKYVLNQVQQRLSALDPGIFSLANTPGVMSVILVSQDLPGAATLTQTGREADVL